MVQKTTICSKEEMRTAITSLISNMRQECPLSEEREYCIKLILNELILNAITNNDNRPAIEILCKTDPVMHQCKILVSSNGPGFDAVEFLKQMECKPCETMAESGRGLMLVKAHSRCLKFNKRGNKAFVSLG